MNISEIIPPKEVIDNEELPEKYDELKPGEGHHSSGVFLDSEYPTSGIIIYTDINKIN